MISWSLAGDEEAFVEVIERHEAAVGAYLARRVGRGAAEDLLGEVWVAAFGSLGGYDRVPQCPAVAVRSGEVGLGWDPWPVVDDRVDGEATLRRALVQLRPDEREVLTLVVWEDLSIADAARTLGIPPGTAFEQARTVLRAEMAVDGVPEVTPIRVRRHLGRPTGSGNSGNTWSG